MMLRAMISSMIAMLIDRSVRSRPQNSCPTSSTYTPVPITHFQGAKLATYCSLSTGSVLPGRGKEVSTKPAPLELAMA